MKADDQVFPIPYSIGVAVVGLSTRDHIAIEAMNGMLSGESYRDVTKVDLSVWAYQIADAMIEESNK